MERPKNQYCRYCANALDYNGECTDFICRVLGRDKPYKTKNGKYILIEVKQ